MTTLSDDVPAGSGGKQSLLMTHVGGKGNLYCYDIEGDM